MTEANEISAPVKVTDEQLGITAGQAASEAIEFDLGHLTAFDPSATATRSEAEAKAQATSLTQALLTALMGLPSDSGPAGRAVLLPDPTTPLPRAKPLPKPREPTKWEKFAQQKGIVKRKRSKLTFDGTEKRWKRRYGYDNAAESSGGPPVIEANASDQVGEDPFSEEKRQKRQRVKANEARHMNNLKVGSKAAGVPTSVQLAASLPEHGRGRPTKRTQLDGAIRSAAARVGKSTASMGKFDKQPANAKPAPSKAGKAQKALPVAAKSGSERSLQHQLLQKVLRERAT